MSASASERSDNLAAPQDGTGESSDHERPLGFGRRLWNALREILIVVVVALFVSFLIKTFLFRAFVIPSGSMEETLQINDRIFVNLMVPGIWDLERGDVVVFEDTKGWLPPQSEDSSLLLSGLQLIGLAPDSSEQHVVKRIIGMPGDHVTVDEDSRALVVNGQILDEEAYLYPGVVGSETDFDVTVPEGQLWVMGDHRNASGDSRAHQGGPGDGFVSLDDVTGRAEVIAWPLNRWGSAGSDREVFSHVPDPEAS